MTPVRRQLVETGFTSWSKTLYFLLFTLYLILVLQIKITGKNSMYHYWSE